jgi:hypothetical protein
MSESPPLQAEILLAWWEVIFYSDFWFVLAVLVFELGALYFLGKHSTNTLCCGLFCR